MKPTGNFWPYAIILTFVLFISGTISLVVMACSQKVDLVSDNYYEQEIRFQGQIDRVQRTSRLATSASVTYNSARKGLLISLPREHAGREITGRVQLYRPSAAGLDSQFDLRPDASATQFLDASSLRAGLWKVRVSWAVDKQDYFFDQSIRISQK